MLITCIVVKNIQDMYVMVAYIILYLILSVVALLLQFKSDHRYCGPYCG